MILKELVAIGLCLVVKTTFSQIQSAQGLQGFVYRIAGNQMPSPGAKPTKPKGLQTTLYIFQLTNLNQVVRQGQSAFYSAVGTKFIAKTATDSNGYFNIELQPGQYSLFAKKGKLYFANWFDKNNNIAPAEVLPGKFSTIEFTVDYDAVY